MPELELCWGTLEKATLPELIKSAADSGFSTVSIDPRSYFAARAQGLSDSDVRHMLAERGVRISYVDGLSSSLPGAEPTPVEVDGEEGFLRVAEAVGATGINLVHFRGRDVERSELEDAIAGLRERAGGLHLHLEFMPNSGIPNIDVAAELAAALGGDRVHIMLDNLHLYRSGGSPSDLSLQILQLVGAVQLSDRLRSNSVEGYVPMSDRLLPGEGDLPVAALIEILLVARPDLPLGVEVFSQRLRDLPLAESARMAAESVRSLLP